MKCKQETVLNIAYYVYVISQAVELQAYMRFMQLVFQIKNYLSIVKSRSQSIINPTKQTSLELERSNCPRFKNFQKIITSPLLLLP